MSRGVSVVSLAITALADILLGLAVTVNLLVFVADTANTFHGHHPLSGCVSIEWMKKNEIRFSDLTSLLYMIIRFLSRGCIRQVHIALFGVMKLDKL